MEFLIGTYTRNTDSEGIYAIELDPDSGRLTEPVLVAAADNPSWLLAQDDCLIAANELDDPSGGEISVFRRGAGGLVLSQNVPSHGADPCHLAGTADRLAVANYSGGNVALYEWAGGRIGRLIRLIEHRGSGPDPRQRTPHPHGIVFIGDELRVADLGCDRIFRYAAADGRDRSEIGIPSGAGPRHMTEDGSFLVNELDNTVLAITLNKAGPATSTLPAGWKGASSTAGILQHGSHLYVSNRGHDSIAVFETAPALRLVQHASTSGQHPRHFSIDPGGRWLLVANRDSHNIVSLPLNGQGLLGDAAAEVSCPSPVCLTRYAWTGRDPG